MRYDHGQQHRRPNASSKMGLSASHRNVSSLLRLLPKSLSLMSPRRLKRVDAGFTKLFSIMRSQIALRRDNIKNEEVDEDDDLGKNVIFDNIVRASVDGGKFALNEGEVMGNTFVMLLAGHGAFAISNHVLFGRFETWIMCRNGVAHADRRFIAARLVYR
jgi:cytochrome P450